MLRQLVVGMGAAALAAGPLAAQDFEIGPRLGYVKWKEATGLENAAMLGLDATYKISSRIGLGVRLDVSRPGTDAQYFPAEMSFGDTTLIFAVKQPVTIMQYGVTALVETGGSFGLFGKGGVFGYRLTLDPQSARGRSTVNELGWAVGGGLRLQTGGGTSVVLEVQDLIYTNFDRDALDPVEARFHPVRFPDAVPAQPAFQGTAHNIYASITFLFTPGGSQ